MYSFSGNLCVGFSRLGEKHEGFIITKEGAIKLADDIIQERVQSRKSNGSRGSYPLPAAMAEEGAPRAGVSRSHELGGAGRGSLRREMACHRLG